jgi:hypothetical protein
MAGGTGQFASLVQALPKSFNDIKNAFRPSDVDVKVLTGNHAKQHSIDELRKIKADILKAFNKLRIPVALEDVFNIKYSDKYTIQRLDISFNRSINTNGKV